MGILIFDFDGTIHDSMCIYAPAVRACQKEYAARGLLPDREVSDAEIRSYLGLTTAQMWQAFAPHLSKEQREEGGQYIYREMSRLARAGNARLYDGAVCMLQELRAQGHRLVFLSNCSEAYMKLHQEVFGLDHIFHEMYCAGQFDWESKPQIVRRLIPAWRQAADRAGCKEPLVIISIGDRYTDMEIKLAQTIHTSGCQDLNSAQVEDAGSVGQAVIIRTIFCAYGFGTPEEGENADATVHSVQQIPEQISEQISSRSQM